jgi:hypothetical protein
MSLGRVCYGFAPSWNCFVPSWSVEQLCSGVLMVFDKIVSTPLGIKFFRVGRHIITLGLINFILLKIMMLV